MNEPRWLQLARGEAMRGVKEKAGVQINDQRILWYHDTTTLDAQTDEVPWCSSFVNWCMKEAGIERTKSAMARSWLEWGRVIHEPAHGCVIILKRGGGNQPGPDVVKAPGHVGFYVGHGCSSEVLVLGGNQANAVNVRPYSEDRVLGYRWPA
jgi:uncharacterized protein (TIGR02594 family)